MSISIPTTANKNVTERQTNNILRYIRDKDEQDRMLRGIRPQGKGVYFDRDKVAECADAYISEYLEKRVEKGDPGYGIATAPTFGMTEYIMPARKGNYTFLLGDPGSDSFPARNSPVVGVIDAYDFPNRPAQLAAFWWGSGGGKIHPFVNKYYEWQKAYRPIFSGVDSTGPQKGTVEVLNLSIFWDDVPVRGGHDRLLESGDCRRRGVAEAGRADRLRLRP